MHGEFLGFSLQWFPRAFLSPSAAYRPMGWHLTQLTVPSLDIRGSQNRICPNFTFAGVMGFSAEGIDEGSGPKIALVWLISDSSALAALTVLTEATTILKTKSDAKRFRMNFVNRSLALIMTVLPVVISELLLSP
jgi:hypothetical protein